jgi:acyl transferase domain-containing protein
MRRWWNALRIEDQRLLQTDKSFIVTTTLHKINPFIPIDELALKIPTQLVPWPRSERRRFGAVSSFGFGGTNAHIVLEEAPPAPVLTNQEERPWHILALSAKDETALRQLAGTYQQHLAEYPDLSVADVCYSANTGRSHMEARMAVAAPTAEALATSLGEFGGGAMPVGVAYNRWNGQDRPKVAFLFTGQGAQYPGMGRQLYDTEPIFPTWRSSPRKHDRQAPRNRASPDTCPGGSSDLAR